ncbi:MAG: hypothetical protein AAGG72_06130 [Pseudomonadota bacterium]
MTASHDHSPGELADQITAALRRDRPTGDPALGIGMGASGLTNQPADQNLYHSSEQPAGATADQALRGAAGQTSDQTSAQASAKSLLSRPLVAGGIGFVVGAAFWHTVGFWGFVSEAVFSGPREQIAEPLNRQRNTGQIVTGSITTGPVRSQTAPLGVANEPRTANEPLSPVRALPLSLGQPAARATNALGTLNCDDIWLDGDKQAAIAAGCTDTAAASRTAPVGVEAPLEDISVPDWTTQIQAPTE